VKWSECDPAGVVFAGRFPEYMANASHLFRDHVLNAPLCPDRGRGYDAPGKAMNVVFLGPLWPRDVFEMSLYLGGVGKHTTHMLIMARRHDNGAPVFAGRLSSIYVDPADRMRTVPVPNEVRERLENYQAAAGPAPLELEQVAL
jgi:acyl-CoA thioesterase FadM